MNSALGCVYAVFLMMLALVLEASAGRAQQVQTIVIRDGALCKTCRIERVHVATIGDTAGPTMLGAQTLIMGGQRDRFYLFTSAQPGQIISVPLDGMYLSTHGRPGRGPGESRAGPGRAEGQASEHQRGPHQTVSSVEGLRATPERSGVPARVRYARQDPARPTEMKNDALLGQAGARHGTMKRSPRVDQCRQLYSSGGRSRTNASASESASSHVDLAATISRGSTRARRSKSSGRLRPLRFRRSNNDNGVRPGSLPAAAQTSPARRSACPWVQDVYEVARLVPPTQREDLVDR